jgi:hypothetical protein
MVGFRLSCERMLLLFLLADQGIQIIFHERFLLEEQPGASLQRLAALR